MLFRIEKSKFVRLSLLMMLTTSLVSAQTDPAASEHLFYIDSVSAGPGQTVSVGFHVKNSISISALTLPIKFDPAFLTLKSISFDSSRGAYINTKLYSPLDISTANGHFQVGFITIFEEPLPAGDGLIFTGFFEVSDTITSRLITILDSLFYPPGGELLFVDAQTAAEIRPDFLPGKVSINGANLAPSIVAHVDKFVHEGDSLVIELVASDPDSDKVSIVCTNKPVGATMIDNGDGSGRLIWVPPFVGPGSADGRPQVINFLATDGYLAGRTTVEITVLNHNRPPVIQVADSVDMFAGDSMILAIEAVDPDFEPVTWDVAGLPDNALFDKGNPATFSWLSSIVDDGNYQVSFIASDPHGAADTQTVNFNVAPVDIYALSFDTVSAFPNDQIAVGIRLDNKLPISGFNLLLKYDPVLLTLNGVTNGGTRTDGFEYFVATDSDAGAPGHLRVEGIADLSGSQTLEVGSGVLGWMAFHIVNDVAVGGNSAPIRYIFADSVDYDDNTMTDAGGNKIESSEIVYTEGFVNVLAVGAIQLGDINLNGVPFEIGDAVYFSNFFVDPTQYQFTALQYANSDLNQDGITATIADLITLINAINSGRSAGKIETAEQSIASVFIDSAAGITQLKYSSDIELGGIFLVLRSTDGDIPISISSPFTDMTLVASQGSDSIRVLLYSMESNRMPSGINAFLEFDGIYNLEIELVQLSSFDGRLMTLGGTAKEVPLPNDFALHQNYPNPFNPETNISFDLAAARSVRLVVYNVLGRKVKTLIDDFLSAGNHQVVWDGRDDNGQASASGIYFYRLDTGRELLTRKMMLIK